MITTIFSVYVDKNTPPGAKFRVGAREYEILGFEPDGPWESCDFIGTKMKVRWGDEESYVYDTPLFFPPPKDATTYHFKFAV